jgi:sorbitol-specific phosphotransferase system component IIBC
MATCDVDKDRTGCGDALSAALDDTAAFTASGLTIFSGACLVPVLSMVFHPAAARAAAFTSSF